MSKSIWRDFALAVLSGVLASLLSLVIWTWKEARDKEAEISCPILQDVRVVEKTIAALRRGELIEDQNWPILPVLGNIHPMIALVPADLRPKVLELQDRWLNLRSANLNRVLRGDEPPPQGGDYVGIGDAQQLSQALAAALSSRCDQ
ncbi:hypothetical protein [Magnetospirillum aberrantis]|uniref:Uncharacterized protein n=1 Tax=Magnetospirillum aberrantis SpK TaxID=908842 RepID=A0A7C9URW6_9PROT|nr:hypothetical protein [Magnetospirillum aberrantis]NFV78888.1 hypothetical protein [Magnetospirillum aberrantis SpK]